MSNLGLQDKGKAKEDVNIYAETPLVRNQRLKLTSDDPYVPRYVQTNATQSSDPAGIYASRIRGRQILLENPLRTSRAAQDRAEKRKRRADEKARKQAGVIGRKEAKEKGVWKLEPSQTKFHLFLPLHHLWMGYMSELLGLKKPPTDPPTTNAAPNAAGMHAKLIKADFHGSIMTVKQCKNPCMIDLSGIVIHETENVFKIVTTDDKFKVVPKRGAMFSFAVPLYSTQLGPAEPPSAPENNASYARKTSTVLDDAHIAFELYGNQFCFRSADRAGRKFKHKETVEL